SDLSAFGRCGARSWGQRIASLLGLCFFFQAEDGIRSRNVTGVQTCALPILIPVLIAVLLAAMLNPVVKVLTRYTFLGRTAASGVALLGLLLVIAGMFTLAGRQLFAQFADIQEKAVTGFQSLTDWATSTFQIDAPMVDAAIDEGLTQLQDNSDQLVSGALGTAAVLGNVATGIVICLFALFFFLAGG